VTGSHARAERAALSDLFERLGPDAPTLCAGWATFDLAAHMVLRERRPDAVPGIALAPLAGYTASVQESLKAKHGYAGLLRLLRSGPGGIYALPGLDGIVNTTEFFVHHEDVRRAQPEWEPRELPADLEEAMWRQLRAMSRLMLRRAPVAVVLNRIGGGVTVGGATKDGSTVELTGKPSELLLFCFGRQAHARVEFSGDETAASRLMEARLGI
jgi:uncharacterized protein (TIGR03085 family)